MHADHAGQAQDPQPLLIYIFEVVILPSLKRCFAAFSARGRQFDSSDTAATASVSIFRCKHLLLQPHCTCINLALANFADTPLYLHKIWHWLTLQTLSCPSTHP